MGNSIKTHIWISFLKKSEHQVIWAHTGNNRMGKNCLSGRPWGPQFTQSWPLLQHLEAAMTLITSCDKHLTAKAPCSFISRQKFWIEIKIWFRIWVWYFMTNMTTAGILSEIILFFSSFGVKMLDGFQYKQGHALVLQKDSWVVSLIFLYKMDSLLLSPKKARLSSPWLLSKVTLPHCRQSWIPGKRQATSFRSGREQDSLPQLPNIKFTQMAPVKTEKGCQAFKLKSPQG